MKKEIKITVEGPVHSGKSTVLYLIGEALTDAGFNVSVDDSEDNGTFSKLMECDKKSIEARCKLITAKSFASLCSKQSPVNTWIN